ncbi:MAG: hypothetical protein ABIA11_03365 [Patescibacteria group bacterium]
MNKFESSIEVTDESSVDTNEKVERGFDKESFIVSDVDTQIEVLENLIEETKEKEAELEPTMDEYLESLKDKYISLKGDEAKRNIISYYNNESLLSSTFNYFLVTYKNSETGVFFGVDSGGYPEDDLCKEFREERKMSPSLLLVEALHQAAGKYSKMCNHLLEYLKKPEFYIKKDFPIRLQKIENFNSGRGGGDRIDMPDYLRRDLVKRADSENTIELKKYMSDISSLFLHELVHYSLDEDGFDNYSAQEELPQMAEFLYDPMRKGHRNEVFKDLARNIINEEEARKEGTWGRYAEACKNFVFPTLIYELNQHGLIKLPISAEDIPKVLTNLPEYYTQLSELERDSILEKYIITKYKEMLELGKKYYEMTGMKDFEESRKKVSQIW